VITASGDRDRRIQFQEATPSKNALGVSVQSDWVLLQKAWALPRFGTSQERREAGAQNASQTATFRVLSTKKLRTVTADDQFRIVDNDGQAWNIVGMAAVAGPRAEIEFTVSIAKG
jgi:head-tail adaptor